MGPVQVRDKIGNLSSDVDWTLFLLKYYYSMLNEIVTIFLRFW